MDKTLEYIKNNKKSFKICYHCGTINHYTNEFCISCNSYYFKDRGQYIEFNVDVIASLHPNKTLKEVKVSV